jgi:hypothetical protein
LDFVSIFSIIRDEDFESKLESNLNIGGGGGAGIAVPSISENTGSTIIDGHGLGGATLFGRSTTFNKY